MSVGFPHKITSIAADAALLLQQANPSSGPVRVGVDVVSIAGFRSTMATRGGVAFVRTRFTEAEQAYCDGIPERLAARWAAKEAVAKVVGTGFRGLRPRQIEIVHQAWGEPTVNRVGEQSWPGDADRWQWSLSLAHEGDAAVAVALAVVGAATAETGDHAVGTQRTDAEPIPLDKEGGHS